VDTIGVLFALLTVLAWGSWLVPVASVYFPSEQVKSFYVSLAAFLLALMVFLLRSLLGFGQLAELMVWVSWVPVAGGIVWALSSYCAFIGCRYLGIAKAFGIWAPLNIITSFFWGMVTFGQFRDSSPQIYLIAGLAIFLMATGICLILFPGSGAMAEKSRGSKQEQLLGIAGACGAGFLWGTYFVPAAYVFNKVDMAVTVSAFSTALPLSLGMLLGTAGLMVFSGRSPRLQSPGDYGLALLSGSLWTLGNFGMLLTVARIGAGPGYTMASLCVVVNALWGIFYFRNPDPRSPAARWVLLGICVATLAGMVLGNLGILETRYGL
jgi:glucose uptake protein